MVDVYGDADLRPAERVEKIETLDSDGWLSESALDQAVSHLLSDLETGRIGSRSESEQALEMLRKQGWVSERRAQEVRESIPANDQHDTQVYDPDTGGSDTQVYDPDSE